MDKYVDVQRDINSCLIINRQYQEFLCGQIISINKALENLGSLKPVKEDSNDRNNLVLIFLLKRLKKNLPINEDQKSSTIQTILSIVPHQSQWIPSDVENLIKGVRFSSSLQNSQPRNMEKQLFPPYGFIPNNSDNSNLNNLSDISRNDGTGLDFELISRAFVPRHSAMNCELQWKFQVNCKLINSDWTSELETSLKLAVDRNNSRNWMQIALNLGENISHIEIMRHYQQKFNTSFINYDRFSKSEDDLLFELLCQTGFYGWREKSLRFEGRTHFQLSQRFYNLLDRRVLQIFKDPLVYNVLLSTATQRMIHTVNKVRSDFIRFDGKVTHSLADFFKDSIWTPEEDLMLIKMLNSGNGVSDISGYFKNKTDAMCYSRYRFLQSSQFRGIWTVGGNITPLQNNPTSCDPLSIEKEDTEDKKNREHGIYLRFRHLWKQEIRSLGNRLSRIRARLKRKDTSWRSVYEMTEEAYLRLKTILKPDLSASDWKLRFEIVQLLASSNKETMEELLRQSLTEKPWPRLSLSLYDDIKYNVDQGFETYHLQTFGNPQKIFNKFFGFLLKRETSTIGSSQSNISERVKDLLKENETMLQLTDLGKFRRKRYKKLSWEKNKIK